MARKAYKLESTSQKCTYSERKLNACGNNSGKILKTVNIMLESNIKQQTNDLTDSLMYTSYEICLPSKLYSISDCIKSKLALSPLVLTFHRISQTISRNVLVVHLLQ